MQERGFFGAMFDVAFTTFITTRISKVLYIVTLMEIGLFALASWSPHSRSSPTGGLVTL